MSSDAWKKSWQKSGRVRGPKEAFGLIKEISDVLMIYSGPLGSGMHIEITLTITPATTDTDRPNGGER